VTLIGGTLGAQPTSFGSGHKPKFTGRWHCTDDILLRRLWNSHADATTLLAAARMAGSSELPEAHAESIIGLGR
jgi:hypothetical protein